MAEGGKLPELDELLTRHLQGKNEIIAVSLIFAKLRTNAQRVSFVYELLEENGMLPELTTDGKSNTKSEEYRQKGNEKFKKRLAKKAHEFYTKSVACAVKGDDTLALAYANRSAVLFEKGLYEECLRDIKLALENNYPETLKSKITLRQSKAEALLPTQQKVKFFTPVPSISTEEQNPLIQSATNKIRIEYSSTLGRHVVATKDIEAGEIIAIEKPFCNVLTDQRDTHCHHCLNLCYTLIPCPNCTQAMFCGEKCLADSNRTYHQYECPILLTIKRRDNLLDRLIHLRVAILAKDHYGSIDQCLVDENEVYRSDRYNEIHNLIANTSQRSMSNLFSRAVNAAGFYHLMKTSTEFFAGHNEAFEDTFKELVLHHMQTGACNFHQMTEIRSSDKQLDNKNIGNGAYSFLSMFNHSCSPNVTRYEYGATMIAVTTEYIKKGEQCFDNYGEHYAVSTKAERQANLKKQYFFDCTCTACVNDYPPYDQLAKIDDGTPGHTISETELQMLVLFDLAEAKKISKKLARKIKYWGARKPNKNLAEFQEALKQCFFIFRTIKTPM